MKKSLIKVVYILIAIVFAISMVGCKSTDDTTSSLTTSEIVTETNSFVHSEEESRTLDEQPSISEFDELTTTEPEEDTIEEESVEEPAAVPYEESTEPAEPIEPAETVEPVETIEAEPIEEPQEEDETANWEYLGCVQVTGYTWTGNPCANGNYPTAGYTVACNDLPFGTVVYIEGIGYRTVEDRGGMTKGTYWMDVYFDTAQECYNATGHYDTWIVK